MGLPKLNVIFTTRANQTAKKAQRGVLAAIVRDDGVEAGMTVLLSEKDIPDKLTAENQSYLKSAFIGNVTKPRKVILCVLALDAEDLSDALAQISCTNVDYIVLPPDATEADAAEAETFVGSQRTEYNRKYKLVAAEHDADKIYCINPTMGINSKTPGEFCARLAGIICGTPLTQSITFVPLPEAVSCTIYSNKELDDKIDAGEIVLVNDTEKIKIGREVNSLTTLSGVYNNTKWKSIRVVEITDVMHYDLIKLYEDYYVGKYVNDFDDKMLLVAATLDYLEEMSRQHIIGEDFSVELDIDATRDYLEEHNVKVEGMSDEEILHADTETHVFVKGHAFVYGTIEDINLNMGV